MAPEGLAVLEQPAVPLAACGAADDAQTPCDGVILDCTCCSDERVCEGHAAWWEGNPYCTRCANALRPLWLRWAEERGTDDDGWASTAHIAAEERFERMRDA